MCGIAGVMLRRGRAPDDAVLRRLAAALAHRGPDGHGRHVAGNVGMIHTRLAIIDLETGDQPLFASPEHASPEDAPRVALIANGEIYNDPEVRRTLGAARYVTGSDCETPLHLYLAHGLDFADRLRGMYAIALHDRGDGGPAGRLVLSRDPFGIKPLYYAETDQGFAFASEPQALIVAGIVEPRVRRSVRDQLLQLQFTTGRPTAFAGIDRVLPGETIVVEDGRIVDRRRRAALPGGGPVDRSEPDALDELDRAFTESVALHRRSDVPYGLFLSGGIDSAAVLAAMARDTATPVLTFTVGFPETGVHDEREAARAVAAAVGAEHVEVAFGEADFWTLLPAIAATMDDPAADFATLPTFRLAAAARDHGIKVVLTGEGGDELFAGYGRYRRALRPKLLGGRRLYDRGALDGLDLRTVGGEWRDGIAAAEAAAAGCGGAKAWTRLQRLQAVDIAEWLPNDLLLKLDRCLMAHGVEGRVPFVDPGVADLAFRLPDHLKIGRRLGKRLLRRWLATALPAAAPDARKRGFTVPVGDWIARRAADLAPLVARQPGIAEAFPQAAVHRLFRGAERQGRRIGQAAWLLLFYALWHQRHICGIEPADDAFETLAERD